MKIQQLEDEIASLRSELESQAYLIDQLSNNNEDVTENNESSNQFTQIDDKIKIDGIYDQAIQSLISKIMPMPRKNSILFTKTLLIVKKFH